MTSDFVGKIIIEIARPSVRIRLSDYGVSLCMTAPDYTVIGINDRSKNYAIVDRKTWQQDLRDMATVPTGARLSSPSDARVAGLSVRRLFFDSHRRRAVHVSPKSTYKGKAYNTTVDYALVLTDTPPEFAELINTLTGLPPHKGFPIRMVEYGEGGLEVNALDTTAIEHVDVPSHFAIPKGYKRCEYEGALLMGDSINTQLAQMVIDPEAAAGGGQEFAQAVRKSHLWVPGAENVLAPLEFKGHPVVFSRPEQKKKLMVKWDPEPTKWCD